MPPDFTLAIPTHNRPAQLASTLTTLLHLQAPPNLALEILVIDNNSTAGTAAAVTDFARRAPWPTRRVREERQGLCHARNRALREAAHHHVAFFDDDVLVAPAWLHGAIDSFRTLHADAVAGPVHARFPESLPAFITPPVRASLASPYSLKGDTMHRLPPHTAHELPGCNFAVRRHVALDLGGFDTRLDRAGGNLLAGGDFEFGRRLVAADKPVVYHPACAVTHVITPEKLTRRYLRQRWYGTGATRRLLQPRPLPLSRRTRGYLGVLRLFLSSLLLRATGQPAGAFERELRARQALGFWRTPPRTT